VVVDTVDLETKVDLVVVLTAVEVVVGKVQEETATMIETMVVIQVVVAEASGMRLHDAVGLKNTMQGTTRPPCVGLLPFPIALGT